MELDCHEISESAAQLCSDIGITLDYEDPINDTRECEEDSRDLCESLKSSTVPFLLQELERRFSNNNVEILSATDALDASNESYLGYSTLSPLPDRFGSCLKIDSGLLKTECERAKIITTAGKYIESKLYPNLFKVIKVSKTIPVGTATVERSFSAMNRILSWARNSLSDSLTSDLMLLTMNKDILESINLDKVLDRWVIKNPEL